MKKVLVSLTTMSSRVANIHKVIDSLLCQEVESDVDYEVLLYISSEPYMLDKGILNLTNELEKQKKKENFNIIFVDNIGSYRKFLYSMQDYYSGKRNFDYIVTADDDTLYPNFWLQTLVSACSKHNCCVAFRGRQIVYDQNRLAPYRNWKHGVKSLKEPSTLNMGTGKDGIIYKPEFFHKGVVELDDVLQEIGHADDLWLKAHTSLNLVPTIIIQPDLSKSFPVVEGSDDVSLYRKLNKTGGNDSAFYALQNVLRKRHEIDINDFIKLNLSGNSTIFKDLGK